MKRINNLFEKICTIDNINLADENARKGKVKSRRYINIHDQKKYEDNKKLLLDIINHNFKTSPYSLFTIHEPKERIIARLPYYPDRIYQHALMNILKPCWQARFIRNTYSCIEGRGIHKCANDLKRMLRKHPKETTYCLKLDVRKFYPSIQHDILKDIIASKIKDKDVLELLSEIIDSYEDKNAQPAIKTNEKRGIPIGNYCSQYFANIYLSKFDEWCKHDLRLKFYFRYADDIVILHHDKQYLHNLLIAIKFYFKYILNLKIKDNYRIFPIDCCGVDFVGFRFYHTYTLLRKSIKRNVIKLTNNFINGKITKSLFLDSFSAYYGWIKSSDSINLFNNIIYKIYKHYDTDKKIYRF